MPIFEYKCQDCEKVFEVLQLSGLKNNEPACPSCKGTNLKKLISTPFLPSSVGRPANSEPACPSAGACSPAGCGSGEAPAASPCGPGGCCATFGED